MNLIRSSSLLLLILSTIMLIKLIHSQETFEPDSVDFNENRPSPSTTNRKHYNRFNEMMKILIDFVTNGNWLNGGPRNLIQYITRTITKLIDVIMNRNNSRTPIKLPIDPKTTNNNNNDDTFEYKVFDSSNYNSNLNSRQTSNRNPIINNKFNRQQKKNFNLNGLLRLLTNNR